MPRALCPQCDMQFGSAAELLAHNKSGHSIPGEPVPTNVPLATPEMLAVVERQKQREQAQAELTPPPAPNVMPDGTTVEPPKPEPIRLTYLYTGQCPSCNKPVKTLELDVAEKHFVAAYCLSCNKQVESREAVLLQQ